MERRSINGLALTTTPGSSGHSTRTARWSMAMGSAWASTPTAQQTAQESPNGAASGLLRSTGVGIEAARDQSPHLMEGHSRSIHGSAIFLFGRSNGAGQEDEDGKWPQSAGDLRLRANAHKLEMKESC